MSSKLAEEQSVRKNSWDRLQGIWESLNAEVDTWKDTLAVRDNSWCRKCGGSADGGYSNELTMEQVENNFQGIEDDLNLLQSELHPQERKDLENHIYAALDATRESRTVLRRVACVLDEFQSIGGRHWKKQMDAAFRYKRLQ